MKRFEENVNLVLSPSGTSVLDEIHDGIGNGDVEDSEDMTPSVDIEGSEEVKEVAASDIATIINSASGLLSSLFGGLADRDKAKNTITYNVTGWGLALAAIALVALIFKK